MAEQTKEQFNVLYGNKDGWSKTTKAAYDHLFGGEWRIVAANKHSITEQTMSAFIRSNERKHFQHEAYANAGK